MTPVEFLTELEPSRRAEMARVLRLIRANIPEGYEEVVSSNMIVFQVPFEKYSDTYNGHPLWYVALASQKKMSLHLMSMYMNPVITNKVEDGFKAEGKKLDMGKACIRFNKADDLAEDVIAAVVGATPMNRWIDVAKAARKR